MILEAMVIRSLGIESGVSKTGNPWEKATIVVETQGQYPKKIALSNMKKAQEFVALPIGALYKFGIDIESREYNGKFYTNVTAYSFEPAANGGQTEYYNPNPNPQPQPQVGIQQTPSYAPQPQPQGNPYAQAPTPQQGEDLPF